MEFVQKFFSTIGDLTWGWSLIPFLVIIGLFFTVATRFIQFAYFLRMFGVLFVKKEAGSRSISGREALLVSVGGRVGGGNIAGVAVAITLGGPGAVFWMWMIALVGMATSLIECSLAQLFKRSDKDGSYRGGPAQFIIYGLGKDYRWLASLYAICLLAAFALGFNAFQGNTFAGAVQESLGIGRIWTGLFLAVISAFIFYGGIQRVAKASDVIVPIMTLGYIAITLVIVLLNFTEIPGVFYDIVTNAFGLKEAVGGGMGAALAQGLRRGLFSNEAGLGSAPNVAATARVEHPITQGITQSLSVFIDTILICSCTAFIILLGNVYVPGVESIDGVVLTQQSLAYHLGDWTKHFLTIVILLFSFSSVIYNYYLGETAISFLTNNKIAIQVLRVSIIGILFLGAMAPGATAVFFFSDPMMGILALINLLALVMLFPVVARLISDYRQQLREGIPEPIFDPEQYKDLNIDHTAWKKNSGMSM